MISLLNFPTYNLKLILVPNNLSISDKVEWTLQKLTLLSVLQIIMYNKAPPHWLNKDTIEFKPN